MMTGYDYEEVRNYMKNVQTAATDSMAEIINELKNNIVTPASTAWYAPEGVKFFEAFKQDVASTKETIEQTFTSYLENVKKAANNWEENIQAAQQSYDTSVDIDATLDVSAMQEQDGTKMGIKEAEMTKISSSLGTVEGNIKSKLQQIAQRLTAESAFLGGTQASEITSCFGRVNDAVSDVFKFLSENLKPEIDKAVTKYGDISKDISSAFQNSSVN